MAGKLARNQMDERYTFIHALMMLHILVGSAQATQLDKQHLLDEVSATWEAMSRADK